MPSRQKISTRRAHPDIPDFVTTNRHFRKFFQGAKEIPGDFSFLSVQ